MRMIFAQNMQKESKTTSADFAEKDHSQNRDLECISKILDKNPNICEDVLQELRKNNR